MREYKTITQPCEIKLVIKKSVFYGRLYPVQSEEEAQDILARLKKQHWDATHNCSAMIIGEDSAFMRYSDDGEPQGTAGVPMLEVLKKNGLTNVLAVVTRYFGGVLLGAGGLVRAYSGSVAQAVAEASRVVRVPSLVFEIRLPFKIWGRAQSALLSAGYAEKAVEYAADVGVSLYVPPEKQQHFLKLIAELSAGKAQPRLIAEEYRDEPY